MRLTCSEKDLLSGKEGPVKALAMSHLVKLGEAFDAEEMVDITYAHMSSGSALRSGEIDYLSGLSDQGARVKVPTSSEVIAVDLRDPAAIGAPPSLVKDYRRLLAVHTRMGIAATYTCVPFTQGYVPPKGACIASMESAAIIYFNAVLGARTNRCGFFVLFAALTGKYPKIGYLLDKNRLGTHLVSVQTNLLNVTDYGALGYHVGRLVGGGVPVFQGLERPRQEELIMLGAGLATSGTVAMYHIPGITPEAPTTAAALGGEAPGERISVNTGDIQAVYQHLCTASHNTVDFIYLGCPQYTLEQIRTAADLLTGKRVHPDTTLWIGTNRMAFAMARRMGYHEIIKKAGGKLVCDTCPVDSFLRLDALKKRGIQQPAVQTMLTDSAKQAHYARTTLGCNTLVDTVHACIQTAVRGK